jgi:hypothetical protein
LFFRNYSPRSTISVHHSHTSYHPLLRTTHLSPTHPPHPSTTHPHHVYPSPTVPSLIHHAIDWDTHELAFYHSRIATLTALGAKTRRPDLAELTRLHALVEGVQGRLKEGDGYEVGNGLIRTRALGVVGETLQGLADGAMGDGVAEGEREKATRYGLTAGY